MQSRDKPERVGTAASVKQVVRTVMTDAHSSTISLSTVSNDGIRPPSHEKGLRYEAQH
jgi:hypothetical protein